MIRGAGADRLSFSQVEMTPPGTMVEPAASPKEKKLLEAKYKIFLEAIDIQRRWRKEMEEANSEDEEEDQGVQIK